MFVTWTTTKYVFLRLNAQKWPVFKALTRPILTNRDKTTNSFSISDHYSLSGPRDQTICRIFLKNSQIKVLHMTWLSLNFCTNFATTLFRYEGSREGGWKTCGWSPTKKFMRSNLILNLAITKIKHLKEN